MSKTFSTMISTVMKTVIRVPRICGTITRKKICSSLAPSIRAASSVSPGTALIADDSSTMEKPTCIQIKITISSMSLTLNVSVCSQVTGSKPSFTTIALRMPICVSPCGL